VNDHYRIARGMCDGQGLPETVLHDLIMTEASEHPKGIVADIFSPEYIRQHGVIHMTVTCSHGVCGLKLLTLLISVC
jgi:hypothetical protein